MKNPRKQQPVNYKRKIKNKMLVLILYKKYEILLDLFFIFVLLKSNNVSLHTPKILKTTI